MHEARTSSIPECSRHDDCDRNDDEDVSSCSAESVAAIECVCTHAEHERSTTINLYARVTIRFLQVKQTTFLVGAWRANIITGRARQTAQELAMESHEGGILAKLAELFVDFFALHLHIFLLTAGVLYGFRRRSVTSGAGDSLLADAASRARRIPRDSLESAAHGSLDSQCSSQNGRRDSMVRRHLNENG